MDSTPVDSKQVDVSQGYDQGEQMSYPAQTLPGNAPPYTAQPMAAQQPYGQQITQQPVPMQQMPSSTTTVVLAQQQPVVIPLTNWNSGICACFDDCESCVIGTFCPQILGCMVASQMNEDCCCWTGCSHDGALGMRVRTRTMYNIQGSVCSDTVTTACCYTCSLCQLRRELKMRGMH